MTRIRTIAAAVLIAAGALGTAAGVAGAEPLRLTPIDATTTPATPGAATGSADLAEALATGSAAATPDVPADVDATTPAPGTEVPGTGSAALLPALLTGSAGAGTPGTPDPTPGE